MNLATSVTMVRIVLLPLILFFWIAAIEFIYISPFFSYWGRLIAIIFYMIAVATDVFDGQIARKRNEVTDFGKVIDQIADKMLVLLGFLLIITDPILLDSPIMVMPVWFAVLVVFINIGRDYVVGIVRQISKEIIPADRFGKMKTMFQFGSIWLFMLWAVSAALNWSLYSIDILNTLHIYFAWVTMIVATALSVLSGVNYVLGYRQAKRASEPKVEEKPVE